MRLPDSFLVETVRMVRVDDSARGTVGMLGFSRSIMYSCEIKSAKRKPYSPKEPAA